MVNLFLFQGVLHYRTNSNQRPTQSSDQLQSVVGSPTNFTPHLEWTPFLFFRS